MSSKVKLDVRVYPIDEPKGSTVAFANVGIADAVAISGIRVVKGSKGNFVSMPQSKDRDGNYHDHASINNDAVKKEMEKAILAEFKSPTRDADGQIFGKVITAEVKDELTGQINAQVFPLKDPQSSTMAFANITVENLVTINGARVVSGEKGDFVAMPQSKDKEGNYHDIAFPINGELRKEMNKAVLDGYNKAQNRAADRGNSFNDRLAEGAQKSANYQKPAAVAKGSPGLGD